MHSAFTTILEVDFIIIAIFQMCIPKPKKRFIFQSHMLVITEVITMIRYSLKT